GIAADADGTDANAFGVVQRQAAAAHTHATDLLANHRFLVAAGAARRFIVGGIRGHRVTVLQAIEAAAGLGGFPKVGGGQRQAWQAEGIGRVGFLRGNHAAAGPLVAAVVTGEGNGAYDAVTVYHG